jgi:hypothetical protein
MAPRATLVNGAANQRAGHEIFIHRDWQVGRAWPKYEIAIG